jgi:hypothetical protein
MRLADECFRPLPPGDQVAGFGLQDLTCFGEFDVPSAVEQPRAEVGFELPDALAQWRLGDAEALGGRPKCSSSATARK